MVLSSPSTLISYSSASCSPLLPAPHLSGVEDGKGGDITPKLGFQQRVTDRLKPIKVDPEDKSLSAKMTRIRNAALSGVGVDVHDVSAGACTGLCLPQTHAFGLVHAANTTLGPHVRHTVHA